MEEITTSKDVTTIIQNKMVIGYIMRRCYLYGLTCPVCHDWAVTISIAEPSWHGNFSTRKEARKYLEQF